jgi:hypothetical protein
MRLFANGTILTMDPARPVAAALAIRDDRIVALGGAAELPRLRDAAREVVDLAGRTVVPGFVDAHNHFAIAALEGFWAECRTPPLATIAEVQAALRAVAAETPSGSWVRGYGYHHAALAERRHPTRWELDEAVPGRPAFLLHFSHHQGVANSAALAAAGITRGTPEPAGGEIGRDRSGEPTGLLFERAMATVEGASREGWEARFPEVLEAAIRRYAAVGITTVQDAAVGSGMEARYRAAEREGRLALAVQRMAVSPEGWFEPPWALARAPAGPGPLKVFVDGGYRCALSTVRAGRVVTRGFLFYQRGELADLLATAWRAGWHVTCHAIGDVGVDVGVGAIEDALRREPRGEGRIRLDHAIFLTEGLIGRIRTLGVPVVTQPSFLYDQGAVGRGLPPGVIERPLGRLHAAGIRQAFSSDYPCGALAPLVGIYAAVTRRARDGRRVDDEPGMSPEAALAAYTIEAARAGGLERECGSLEPGKRADFVVLDRNPLAQPPDDLLGVRVVRTFAAGREVWP